MSLLYDTAVRVAEGLADKEDLRALRGRAKGFFRLLRHGAYPLHRNEKFSPFFVIGSGRCGTTLFRRLMQAQGNTYIPPENWALGRCIQQYHKYGWSMDWKDMVDLQVGTLSHRSHHWFESPPRDLVRSLHSLPSEERSLAALINAEYMYHAGLKGREPKRWGDKTPGNVFCAEAISEVFPEAKFIHLLRDGVDVVASWIKYDPYTADLEGAIEKWRCSARLARKFLDTHPEKGMEVRYEDLVRKPDQEMESVCRFLDHPFDSGRLEERDPLSTMDDVVGRDRHENIKKSISTDGIGKGRRQLSTAQKKVVKEQMGDTLQLMGYEPTSLQG